jgi:hypothetical protein
MKKYLPFIVVIIIAFVVVGGIFIVKKINQPVGTEDMQQEDAAVPDLPQDQWPTVTLIPSSDGHTLLLRLNNIKVTGAKSMDYELIWTANNTGTPTNQGTSGTIQLNGQTTIEKSDLLLGSESSGKRRYDKGVENGKLTIRFRDGSGKLLGKVASDFHLQTATANLSSVDGSFKYTLKSVPTGVWFITIKPFGTPDTNKVVVFQNGWAIYSSDGKLHTGS